MRDTTVLFCATAAILYAAVCAGVLVDVTQVAAWKIIVPTVIVIGDIIILSVLALDGVEGR